MCPLVFVWQGLTFSFSMPTAWGQFLKFNEPSEFARGTI